MINETRRSFLQDHRADITTTAQRIFTFAELADEEQRSSRELGAFLERSGFSVKYGIGGMPTSLRAEWGNGSPVIGFLGEYDALPELDQPPVPYYCGDAAKSGHGCGHNLLGTGAASAAAAMAAALKAEGKSGTVVFYGCPAEEILKGKVVMAKNGCFRELDAALSWHPAMENRCGELAYLAMDSIQFHFHGKAAHASAAPHRGRSALDAVELMNVGANYLREHVTDDVRIHYAHLPNGAKPNIVPAEAGVWYFVRARERSNVDDVTNRLTDIARGAGLMTSTSVDWEFLSRGYGTLVNFTLCRLAHDVMIELGHPNFSPEERAFATALSENMGSTAQDGVLDESFDEPQGKVHYMTGSTDVSDVSQIVPTLNVRTACGPKNIVLHSWQFSACAGSDVGRRGMFFAADVLAQTGWQLIAKPGLLARVKEEFRLHAGEYKPLL